MASVPGGTIVQDTKTHAARRIALDPATLAVLARHRKAMKKRAKACRVPFAVGGLAFTSTATARSRCTPIASPAGSAACLIGSASPVFGCTISATCTRQASTVIGKPACCAGRDGIRGAGCVCVVWWYCRPVSETTSFELSVRDRKRLAAQLARSEPLAVRTGDSHVGLPPVAQRAVEQLLTDLATGGVVHVLAEDRDLTTQDVADLLGLSRTFVVRLIDGGKLPAHLAGSHRRVRAADAVAYAQERRQRLAAVDAIADADSAAGVEYR